MNLSKGLKNAVKQLYYWQHGSTCFTANLYSLMQKADAENLARIKKGFPNEFEAWTLWRLSSSQDEFFKCCCPELLVDEDTFSEVD